MREMRGVALTAASFGLTMAVVGHAYFQKKQFYPSVVYLTKSNPSMAVLYVQAFVLVILMGKLFKKVFFGQLRAAEMEHLIERSWYAVTETCLAFTVFRDDFSPRFVAMFTLLLFLKCFHWLAEDRVDYMERSPVISFVFHMRVLSLLLFLGLVDAAFINFAYHSTLTKGASVQLVFGFEYAILLSIIINVFFKYILHTIDLQSENPWENKAVYMLYTDLVMGFIKVFLYTAFMAIMIKVHTFPLFAIRPMYLTMRSFKKAVNDVIMSRRAIRNMNTLYPDATPEDLATTDNLCIICREEMVTGCKKLPCSHIFHTSCLRSWFQRQQTCPTCRMDVLRAPTQQQQQRQQNGAAGQQQQQQQQQHPQGMMPPFPGYPFWMAPFQPPGAGGPMQFPPGAMPPGAMPPGAMPPGFPPAGANPPGQPPAADQTGAAGGDQPDSGGTQPPSSASTSQTSTTPTTTTTSTLPPPPVFPPPPPGTSPPGGTGQTPPMPGGMPPPFMPPPPFMFMPPFGVPPPMPPPNFSGMSEEEVRAMEGNERRHLEARIECLRSIHSLLDAAMVQVAQYTAVINSLGSSVPAPPPANLYPQTNTRTGPSPSTLSAADCSPVNAEEMQEAAGGSSEDDNGSQSTMKKAKDSTEDLSQLEGAVGFTPATEGELIPDAAEEPDEHDHQEIRRRRLQKLSSQEDT